jgi:hypothetical protein
LRMCLWPTAHMLAARKCLPTARMIHRDRSASRPAAATAPPKSPADVAHYETLDIKVVI